MLEDQLKELKTNLWVRVMNKQLETYREMIDDHTNRVLTGFWLDGNTEIIVVKTEDGKTHHIMPNGEKREI